MDQSTPTMTRSSADLTASLELVEIKPGVRFSLATLRDILPDAETAIFFGKVYELDYAQLSHLLSKVLNSDLAKALFKGDHSTDLQDYVVDICAPVAAINAGKVRFKPDVPKGEILPELWKMLEVEVAKSLLDVAKKLENVVGLLPGKQGSMVFSSMLKLNKTRPTLGVHQAAIHHAPVKENLLILDVSGSMSEHTVRTIVDDVVALSYMANAHLAIVSYDTTHWEPGTYSVDDVLQAAAYGGTHYETLRALLDRDWGTVITVADYDSSLSAKAKCAKATGWIDTVIDVSLVNQPTFLAECVGQRASKVQPMLIANSAHVVR